MSFRLAIFDVDGTIVGPGGVTRPSVGAAIATLPPRGVQVAPVSTRPFQWARRPFQEAGVRVPAIAAAGADVRSDDSAVIRQIPLEPATAAFALELFDRFAWHGLVCTPGRAYSLPLPDEPGTAAWLRKAAWLRTVTSMTEERINDVVAIVAYEPSPEALEALREWDGQLRYDVIAATPGDLLVVTHADVSRLSGMLALCDAYGIPPSDTVVFADGVEDIPMMQTAGLAVAVGDAPWDVQRNAGLVTNRRDEDGLANAIAEIWG